MGGWIKGKYTQLGKILGWIGAGAELGDIRAYAILEYFDLDF